MSKTFKKRRLKIRTLHGELKTPFFMPCATRGVLRNLSSEDLKNVGAKICLANTYHLHLRPGEKLIKRIGGLHEFMYWDNPILTDSGGFQVFSLGARKLRSEREKNRIRKMLQEKKEKESHRKSYAEKLVPFVKISEKDVEFISVYDGSYHRLSPEKVVQIQLDLGVDIQIALDMCTEGETMRKKSEDDLKLNNIWAERGRKYFLEKVKIRRKIRPLQFGVIQGKAYKDLRIESAKFMTKLDFDGYAIGGLAIGGDTTKKMQEVLSYTVPLLPKEKPRYLMGVGYPEDIVEAYKKGVDMFDCVIPSREGRHGRLFVFDRKLLVKKNVLNVKDPKKIYNRISIKNAKHKNLTVPIDDKCSCETCQNYSLAYLRHLFSIKENLVLRLLTIHNLRFYCELMEMLCV